MATRIYFPLLYGDFLILAGYLQSAKRFDVYVVSRPVFSNYISFTNGSIITFVRASDNARGHKFHHILYDRNIDHELLACVVLPTEIRYTEEHNGTSR